MKNLGMLGWVSLALVIVGGINWGFYGIFKIDLVALILGEFTLWTRLVYILVGSGAVHLIYWIFAKRR